MKILILIVALFMFGCANTVKTKIVWHDKKVINIESQSDGMLKVTLPDGEVEVDYRGKPGFLEKILGLYAIGGARR